MLARLPYFKFALVALIATLVTPAIAAPPEDPGQGEGSAVKELRRDFNRAMNKSLNERVSVLEQLDQRIGQTLDSGGLMPGKQASVLKLRYRARRGLGRYEDAAQSFSEFAAAMKQWNRSRASRAVPEFVRNHLSPGTRSEVVNLADAALETWSDHERAAPALLLAKAEALSGIPGRRDAALPVLETIIGQFPESPYHPKALRQLAHLQANGYGDGPKAAFKTLDLIERQYAGTWWEQYAHMKDAVIYEERQGKPQQALERYRATLEKFPSHKYGVFIRRRITRLQDVIEQQLIDDALKNVRRGDEQGDHERRSLAHRSGELIGFSVDPHHERLSFQE